MLQVELQRTAEWALGMAALSTLYSIGRNTVSYVLPEGNVSDLIGKFVPNPSMIRSLIWGTFCGAYTRPFMRQYPNPGLDRLFQIFTSSGFLSSFTTSLLFPNGASPLEDIETHGKPLAIVFLSYAAGKVALFRLAGIPY